MDVLWSQGYAVILILTCCPFLASDLHTKYPQEMHVVYNEMQPYLSSQSADMFRDQLPAITLRHDLVSTW